MLDFSDYNELRLDNAVFFTHLYDYNEPLYLVGKIVSQVLKKFSYTRDEQVLARRAFVSLKTSEYDTRIKDVLWMELQSDSSSSMEPENLVSKPAASNNRV